MICGIRAKDEYIQDVHVNLDTFPPLLGLPSDNRSYNPFRAPGVFSQATLTVPVNESRLDESSAFTYTQDGFLPVSPPQDLPFDNHSHNPFEPPGILPQATLTLPVNESRPGESSVFPYRFLPVPPLQDLPFDNHSYNPFEPPGVLSQATLTLPVSPVDSDESRSDESSAFRYAQDRFLPVPPPLGQPFDNHAYNPLKPPGDFHQAPLTLPVLPASDGRLGSESFVPSIAMVMNPIPKRLNEDERRASLEHDAYVMFFDAKTVICSGCFKKIKLDGRDHARFYTTNWYNHKARCLGVEVGMTAAEHHERNMRNKAG